MTRKRMVYTADEVVDRFVATGETCYTARAGVPSGRRVWADPDGQLRSYRTCIAERLPDGGIAVGLQRYSVSTSNLQSYLRSSLLRHGYWPSTEDTTIHAAVPGRWGGFGPAWHATGWDEVPARIYRRHA
jgi:hypothetical protein